MQTKKDIKATLDRVCLQIIARQNAEIKSGEYSTIYNYDALYHLFNTMRDHLVERGLRSFKTAFMGADFDPVEFIRVYKYFYFVFTAMQEETTRRTFKQVKNIIMEVGCDAN